ncbi:hypothetical protein [Methylosinus sp. sav-2]|uniref:hypothetical protein n=1 Tax=Methylosinus sp. sav-2 TaxID=2485168 RepID=UPI00047AA153|nr:hypothetical protein [Methylosinus sp. sav-2]
MMRNAFLAPALLAMLGGCGHIPVSTLWALRGLDASTLSPERLRAAVRVPDALEPRPDGVTLEIGWWRDGRESEKRIVKFVLRETKSSADVEPLAGERKAGTRIHAFRVDPADIEKIRALQTETRAEMAKGGGKTHGTLGIGAEACRRGDLPEGPVMMTTFIRAGVERDYLTLLDGVDLRAAVGADKSLDELAPPCAKFANRVDAASAR